MEVLNIGETQVGFSTDLVYRPPFHKIQDLRKKKRFFKNKNLKLLRRLKFLLKV